MKKSLLALGAIVLGTLSLTACIETPNGGVILQPVPVSVPVIIQGTDNTSKTDNKNNQSVHVCKISAFTHTYTAEDTNRGKAKLKAKKQCLSNFHDMFCKDEDISCQEYK